MLVLISVVLAVYLGIVYGNGVSGDDPIGDGTPALGDTFTVEDVKKYLDYNHSGFNKDDIIKVYSVGADKTRTESDAVIKYDSEGGVFSVVGVGNVVIVITNTVDKSMKIEAELKTRFSSLDTLALVKTAIPEIDSDGIVSAEELSAVERIIIKDRQSVDGSDIQMLSSLKRIDIEGNAEVVKIENLNLPSGVSVHVSPERYTAYMNSDLWQSYKESIFATTADKDKVSIVLHKNGGTLLEDSGIEIETESITAGERLNLEKYNGILKTGYGLVSWYTYEKIDGESVKVTVDENYIFNNSTKLYAEWIPNKYTVKFHLNNGSEDLSTVFSYDEEKPLIATAPEYKKHILLGWTIEDGSYNVDYDVKEAVKNLSAENGKVIDLYAVWVTETFKVSYYNWSDTPEVYASLPIPTPKIYNYGAQVTISVDNPPSDPSNVADFIGWSVTPNATVPEFKTGDVTDEFFGTPENGGEIKLYAIYNYSTYTIKFYNSSSSHLAGATPDNTIANLQKGVDMHLPADPTKYGCKFLGWRDVEGGIYYCTDEALAAKLTETGESCIYAPNGIVDDGVKTSHASVTLVAMWQKNTFKLSFVANGSDEVYSSATLTAGEAAALSGSFYKKGYIGGELFALDLDNYKLIVPEDNTITAEGVNILYELLLAGGTHQAFNSDDAEIVFTAQGWTPITYYIVYAGTSIPSQTVLYGESVNLAAGPAKSGTTGKTNYVFEYWAGSDSHTYASGASVSNLSEVDGDTIVMSPKYITQYYLTITSSGETGGSVSVSSGWYNAGRTISFNVTYIGDESKYWTLDGGSQSSSSSGSITMDTYHTLDVHSNQSSCLGKGTLITMADGSQKRIEDIVVGDMVMTLDHTSGRLVASAVAYTYYAHSEVRVLTLTFSNAAELEFINTGHGLYDITLDKYVLLTPENAHELVGHSFATINADGEVQSAQLVSTSVTQELVERYDIVTAGNLNHIANGMLACSDTLVGVCNTFDFDSLVYDEAQMQADIEKYGLYTYEEWSEYVSYEEFVAFNGAYFKIAIGKGLLTEDELFGLILDINTDWE